MNFYLYLSMTKHARISMKKVGYRIVRDCNLLIQYYHGEISLNDIYNSADIISNDPDFDNSLNILNDLREAILITDEESIKELIAHIKKSNILYYERKTAFITSTPNQVVFSTLIELLKNESLVNVKTVSTLENALIHLIGNREKFDEISEAISDLKDEKKSLI